MLHSESEVDSEVENIVGSPSHFWCINTCQKFLKYFNGFSHGHSINSIAFYSADHGSNLTMLASQLFLKANRYIPAAVEDLLMHGGVFYLKCNDMWQDQWSTEVHGEAYVQGKTQRLRQVPIVLFDVGLCIFTWFSLRSDTEAWQTSRLTAPHLPN